jgi:hypothetical protein
MRIGRASATRIAASKQPAIAKTGTMSLIAFSTTSRSGTRALLRPAAKSIAPGAARTRGAD